MSAQLTIEQLAAQSGMSVRNIRAHQARGLLAAPKVRLRVGYYGPEHIAQLRLIRQLQEQGFNLGGASGCSTTRPAPPSGSPVVSRR